MLTNYFIIELFKNYFEKGMVYTSFGKGKGLY